MKYIYCTLVLHIYLYIESEPNFYYYTCIQKTTYFRLHLQKCLFSIKKHQYIRFFMIKLCNIIADIHFS
jgi:hypothetical protein